MAAKCNCPGKTHERWTAWRVIARPGRCTRLYCLRCRHSWLTQARYAQIMRDHKPHKRSGMSDEDILARLHNGSLIVNCEVPFVDSVTRLGKKRLRVVEHTSNGSSYRFVEVTHKGKKKKIALHRLVWIAANLQLPPEGYDIDHERGPFDGISNLRLREQSENRSDTSRTRAESF